MYVRDTLDRRVFSLDIISNFKSNQRCVESNQAIISLAHYYY